MSLAGLLLLAGTATFVLLYRYWKLFPKLWVDLRGSDQDDYYEEDPNMEEIDDLEEPRQDTLADADAGPADPDYRRSRRRAPPVRCSIYETLWLCYAA